MDSAAIETALLAGYGVGEVEFMLRVVTGFLNPMSYNVAGFDYAQSIYEQFGFAPLQRPSVK